MHRVTFADDREPETWDDTTVMDGGWLLCVNYAETGVSNELAKYPPNAVKGVRRVD